MPLSLGEDTDRVELAVLAGNIGYLKFTGRSLRACVTDVRWADSFDEKTV
ncbi:hypothetical protein [Streptomyces sp. NPDC018693]